MSSQPERLFNAARSGTRLRIAAVGIHGLREMLENLAPEYAQVADVLIIDKAYDQAVQSVQALSRQNSVDAVVSAGSNGSYLREHLTVPVATVRAGGFDLMERLAQAAQHAKRLAMVVHREIPAGLKAMVLQFSLPVHLLSYHDEEDAQRCVQKLQRLGVDTVLAPGLVVDLARAAGMNAMLLYSPAAVRAAMQDAIEMARVSRAEAARHDRLNAILAHLRDAVLAVDLNDRIYALNPSMLALLGLQEQDVQGQYLHRLKPELSLLPTIRAGKAELERVQQIGGRTMVLTRIPIVEQGHLSGAVLVCQDPATIQRLDRSLRSRRSGAGGVARYELDDLIGDSAIMQQLRRQARAFAHSSATALVYGESGTGKELLAQGMHQASLRQAQPFVAINCGAFPESLLESELFGYVEGAFTGSSRGGKVGLFEAAHTGTLFLDEIGEMPLALQTRLLRVLQEKEVLRIGAIEPTPVDVRVIAATHQNLAKQVKSGGFRQDLFYRLNILVLHLPPLRSRIEDLPLLLEHLQQRVAARLGQAGHLPEALIRRFRSAGQNYDWPGNIRELENLVERAMVLQLAGIGLDEDYLQHIAPELFGLSRPGAPAWQRQLQTQERAMLEAVLAECGGNREQAARKLGISRSTLWRRLNQSP